MTQVGSSTEANNTTTHKPLPISKDEMNAKLQKLLNGVVEAAKSIDSKSLVERATSGTKDDSSFS